MSTSAPATPSQAAAQLAAAQACKGGGALAADTSATQLAEVQGEFRVYKVTLQPGQRSMVHTHDLAHTTLPLTNGSLQYYDSEGKCCGKYEIKCCEPRVLQVQGDRLVNMSEPAQSYPKTHCIENCGTAPYSEYVMELMNPCVAHMCSQSAV